MSLLGSLLLVSVLSNISTLSLAFQILDLKTTTIGSAASLNTRTLTTTGRRRRSTPPSTTTTRPSSSICNSGGSHSRSNRIGCLGLFSRDPLLVPPSSCIHTIYSTALAAEAERSSLDRSSSSRDTAVNNLGAVVDDKNPSSGSQKNNKSLKQQQQQQLELPWGQRQKWALRDNISKYTVEIPQLRQDGLAAGGSSSGSSTTSSSSSSVYVMWRAMTRDIFELAGYDVEFLRSKYLATMNGNDIDNEHDTNPPIHSIVPGVLPLIDKFEFQSNGGISGKIEGLGGIANGTTIQTSPLAHVQLTIPRGYVITEDGSAAYELGVPLSEEKYSFDLANMLKNVDASNGSGGGANVVWQDTVRSGVQETGKMAMMSVAGSVSDKNTRDMLVNLGATTAILLGGATAVNMLSHHLTVNVFWV
jgi:hypothetical protein